jgi:hypothetical protein
LGNQAAREGDISAWQSLMIYMGVTLNPTNFLTIPTFTFVAARRLR